MLPTDSRLQFVQRRTRERLGGEAHLQQVQQHRVSVQRAWRVLEVGGRLNRRIPSCPAGPTPKVGSAEEGTNPTITGAAQSESGRDSVDRGPEAFNQPVDRPVTVVSHVQQLGGPRFKPTGKVPTRTRYVERN